LLLLGYPEQAQRTADEALATANEVNLPTALVAVSAIVVVHLNLRMPKVARVVAEQGLAAAERSGFGFVIALWRARLGWAIAQEGNPEKGLAMIRDALKKETLDPFRTTGCALYVIDALSIAGRYDDAIVEVDALLARQPNSLGFWLADAHLLRGEAILGHNRSRTAEAEACFRKAIEVARKQSAKWWELRATTSLARLLRDTNRRDEARAMLGEIYDWFTEGFDTADLKEAKALLEELSA
jgi:tetratricopeptide (TPR) repeat protein